MSECLHKLAAEKAKCFQIMKSIQCFNNDAKLNLMMMMMYMCRYKIMLCMLSIYSEIKIRTSTFLGYCCSKACNNDLIHYRI